MASWDADSTEIQWLLSSVKFALGTDVLSKMVLDPEAARGAKERLCNEDGPLFVINRFFNAKPGSALFLNNSGGPLDKVLFTEVAHDDDKSAVSLPSAPYAFLIKTRDTAGAGGLLASLEFGLRTKDALTDMEDTIRNVYLPSLAQAAAEKAASATEPKAAANSAGDGSDLLVSSVERFGLVLSQEIQCRRGQVTLKFPVNTGKGSKHRAKTGPPSFAETAEMESCVEDWLREVGTFLQVENAKVVPASAGPLAEIAYWRDRNVTLSGVHEQLQAAPVAELLARLRTSDSGGLVVEFAALASELLKQHAEAKDNVKFLSTLERHFSGVHNDSFDAVREALPSMLNAIRMVWIVSRSFNTDEKLVPLMERVAGELTRRVSTAVRVGSVLQLPGVEAAAAIESAAALLNEWEASYLTVRERINSAASSGQPWEFDRRRLFGKSRYMATVCTDLLEVTTTLEQFHRFLSPEVKIIVGKRASEVDAMLISVSELKEPFIELSFDVFDRAFKDAWVATMDQFRVRVGDIEDTCKQFIETAFQELRSAEGAFDLVKSFETIKSRGPINAHIAARYQDILQRFNEELEQLEELFRVGKDDPPLVKDYTPIAGSIAWATGLYKRAKRTVLKFRSREGLLESPFGERVKAHYLSFARAVDAYVQGLYENWATKAVDAVAKLKEPLLVTVNPDHHHHHGGGHRAHHEHDASKKKESLPKIPYAVNFGPPSGTVPGHNKTAAGGGGGNASVAGSLGAGSVGAGSGVGPGRSNATGGGGHGAGNGASVLDIISESRALDAMGFSVPPAAVSVTLQSPQLRLYALGLENMLKRLHATLAALTPAEEKLLSGHKKTLLTVLHPGFNSYNWTSQRIPAFTQACNQAITTFESALDAVHSHGSSMQNVLDTIANTALFTVGDLEEKMAAISAAAAAANQDAADDENQDDDSPSAAADGGAAAAAAAAAKPSPRMPLSITTFIALIEEKKRARLATLAEAYKSMTPLLLKVEEEVAGTNSGASASMNGYYAYWEAKVFNAVTALVVRSLATMLAMLQSPEVGAGLLQVSAAFSGSDLQVTPSLASVLKTLTGVTRGLVEAARVFPRWMFDHEQGCGTCLVAPPVVLSEDEDAVVVSFYDEIIKSPVVVRLMLELNHFVHRTSNDADAWLDTWRAFDTKEGLWSSKRNAILEKTRKQNPSVVFYDTKLAHYAAMVEDAASRPGHAQCGFLRVDGRALAAEVVEVAGGWKQDYASLLHDSARSLLEGMEAKLAKQRKECLGTETSDLDALKAVLNAVAFIEAEQMDVELAYSEVVERYRTLAMFGCVSVGPEEHERAMGLPATCRQLFVDAKTRDLRLVDTKAQFRVVTITETEEFVEQMGALKRAYLDGGPGISGDLDKGLEMVAEYTTQVEAASRRKAELANAQSLFGLDIVPYPDLTWVATDLEKMHQIYDLYQVQKDFQDAQSSTLWGELDVKSLQDGCEAIEKKCKKFPEELRSIPVFKDVATTIAVFKDSLPLIVSLKNDAMQPRHW